MDQRSFAVFVYDNHSGTMDDIARRLSTYAAEWRPIASLADDECVACIREDRIDVLVDLSGHTAGNRLPVFARRAAPVQMTWFAYMNTTGLRTMDYRITDALLAPPGSERFYTEKLLRISPCVSFGPDPASPPVGPLPADLRGYITFGSFNNWTKVSAAVLDAWARILCAVGDARLLAVVPGGEEPYVGDAVRAAFRERGVEDTRLEIRPTGSMTHFLGCLGEVDIALDTFPYAGGTTTLHTLWMGVPVVTLGGHGETGRSGATIMANVELGELVAHSVDRYCEIAAMLARDRLRLRALRAELRARMARSPIMHADEATRAFEGAVREAWRSYVVRVGDVAIQDNRH